MTGNTLTRPEPLYKQISRQLQRQIADGTLKPGEMIPSTFDLAKEFQVANQTAQNALKELSLCGDVVRIPGKGTYVSDNKTVALVAGRSLLNEPDTLFYSRLAIDAADYLKSRGWNAKIYSPTTQAEEEKMIAELDADVRLNKVKCILVITLSSKLKPWLEDHCRIPWVGASSHNYAANADQNLLQIGLPYLANCGYRSIGLLYSKATDAGRKIQDLVSACLADIAEPLRIEYYATQTNYPKDGMAVVMEQLSRSRHPEALFVLDDNLCRGAVVGLLANRISFPDKIGLLTHANKEIDILSPIALDRIEISFKDSLHANIEKLINPSAANMTDKTAAKIELVKGASCLG
jgi:DNA-binding transcriptional regulator YhcF (GntR family)